MAGVLAAVAAATLSALIFRVARARATRTCRVVVVGDRDAIESAVSRWPGTASVETVGGCLVVPDPDLGIPPDDVLGVPVVLGPADLVTLARSTRADLVVVVPGPTVTSRALAEVSWHLEDRGPSVAVLGPLDLVAPYRVSPGALGGATLVHVEPSTRSVLTRSLKGALDRASGLVLLTVSAPLLVVLAVVIRLDSRGPAIFRQTRVGRDGREFTMNKLRTMCEDAEQQKAALSDDNEVDGALFKIKRDPRITRVGHFLRRSSLDELPQLINVVKGEMSLIGPRPALPGEVATYNAGARRRLAVKPGITGLWQVSGRSDLPWDEAMRLDLHYADNWRLTDDVLIALRTVKAVASSKGAY
ncbi:sugar transferase [Nocardioides speluncae]|uniref:sugar transferase n=1 Tax=Nocardioides speluncae TaxID=2670337 RepID=UPI0019816160|nr:sugar transferase [Nocardioides speluncae]